MIMMTTTTRNDQVKRHNVESVFLYKNQTEDSINDDDDDDDVDNDDDVYDNDKEDE